MLDLAFARKYIERMYLDTCTVIEYAEVTDPETHISGMQEVIVHENIPCKLSHHLPMTSTEGVASGLRLSSYIYVSPDITIKPGSKIIVTRNGKEIAFKNSGEPAMHINHQKIMLEVYDERA